MLLATRGICTLCWTSSLTGRCNPNVFHLFGDIQTDNIFIPSLVLFKCPHLSHTVHVRWQRHLAPCSWPLNRPPPPVPGPAVPHWGVNPRLQYSGGLSVLYIFSFSPGSSVSANSVGISFMGADSLSFHSAVTVLSAAAAQPHTGYWRGQKYTPDVSALLQGVMG